MKGYIVYQEQGEYDYHTQWVECIYLVPDDFSYRKFWDESMEEAKKVGLLRTTKKGLLYAKDWRKGQRYVNDRLEKTFNKLEVIEDD